MLVKDVLKVLVVVVLADVFEVELAAVLVVVRLVLEVLLLSPVGPAHVGEIMKWNRVNTSAG